MPPVTGRKSSPSPNGKPQPASAGPISPYWQTSDGETVRLYLGEVRDVLARMPARSVQCVVTSPPYWGLRDYGTGFWEGGNPECDHKRPSQSPSKHVGSNGKLGTNNTNWDHRHEIGYKGKCGKCGAIQVDSQIGSEPSPDCGTDGQAQCGGCFVCTMVAVFRGVRRVLRDDGCMFLNLGDSYGSPSLPSGNLVGVPWRVALALQADGWVLRQDIIWAKPAPMPESVTDRCTKAHEYVFLLTKSGEYYYDAEAIKEKAKSEYRDTDFLPTSDKDLSDFTSRKTAATGASMNNRTGEVRVGNSNKRSVWTVSSQGYPGAHFATFPPKLIEPMILAGTSEKGACAVCGAPWGRVVESSREATRPALDGKVIASKERERIRLGESQGGVATSTLRSIIGNRDPERHCTETRTAGWAPGCRCGSESVRSCVVLDPFVGSGTTMAVANDLGRWGWGIDLSEEYIRNHAVKRVEGALLRRPATSGLTGRARQPVMGLGRAIKTL